MFHMQEQQLARYIFKQIIFIRSRVNTLHTFIIMFSQTSYLIRMTNFFICQNDIRIIILFYNNYENK